MAFNSEVAAWEISYSQCWPNELSRWIQTMEILSVTRNTFVTLIAPSGQFVPFNKIITRGTSCHSITEQRTVDSLPNIHLRQHLYSSVWFSCSIVSDFLQLHEPQHARPPCPSSTPGVYPNSCPLSQRCHPANSYSVVPFSSCPQSLPASESFPMSQLFSWGG